MSDPDFTHGFFPTHEQLRALAVLIREHEGLEPLRDRTHGTVRIETAYVIQILDALCNCLLGEESFASASAFIRAMAP